MTKDELLEAVKSGRIGGPGAESVGYDFDVEDGWSHGDPEHFLLYAMTEGEVTLDGKNIEIIEDTQPNRDYFDENIHGQGMKFVFKVNETVFVAIGQYDSWDGEHFPNGFSEAELVDVPTWLPKA